MRYKRGVLFCVGIVFFIPFFFLYIYIEPIWSAIFVLINYKQKSPIYSENLIFLTDKKGKQADVVDQKVAICEQNETDKNIDFVSDSESIQEVAGINKKKNGALSLNNLVQGFQTYANHRKEQKREEQNVEITELRFLEKLIQSVLTQLRFNRQNILPYVTQEYGLHCAISLERDGISKHIVITKTSGNIFLDSLCKKIVQDASGAFPPIPKSIKKDPYMFILDIRIGNYVSLQVLLPK